MVRGHRPARRAARGRGRRRPRASERIDADAVLVSTGSRPRIPEWAPVDGDRVLTTRDAYPPPELPEHLVVVGSGVTGVEFVHMFSSLRLRGHAHRAAASRCCRRRTPRSPPRWRTNFLDRGVEPAQGRPGHRHRPHRRRRASSAATTAARSPGQPRAARHRLDPQHRGPRPRDGRRRGRRRRLRPDQPPLPDQRAAHLRRRRPVGEAAAVVGGVDAGPQDRRARDGPAHPASTATSTTTRRRRPSSPSPRSPTSAWPRPTPSPRAARSGSPRCRSRPRPRRSSTATPAAS